MKKHFRNFARLGLLLAFSSFAVQPAAATTLTNGILNAAYSHTLTASGGAPPYQFTFAGGSLPPGLTLAGNGALSGNATNAGAFSFQVVVTDTNGCTGVQNYSLTIVSLPAASALTGAKILSNGLFQFAFTNTPGANFSVFGTTNVSVPFSNWSFLGSLTDSPPGQFQFTDPQTTNNPRRFYRVRSP